MTDSRLDSRNTTMTRATADATTGGATACATTAQHTPLKALALQALARNKPCNNPRNNGPDGGLLRVASPSARNTQQPSIREVEAALAAACRAAGLPWRRLREHVDGIRDVDLQAFVTGWSEFAGADLHRVYVEAVAYRLGIDPIQPPPAGCPAQLKEA